MRSQAMPKARPFAPDYLWRRKPVREDDEKEDGSFLLFHVHNLQIVY